jgi:fibronectin-binding autotransporter adhesin
MKTPSYTSSIALVMTSLPSSHLVHSLKRANKFLAAVMLAGAITPSAFAASQTWTNAPVNQNWNNTNNWVGRAVPGALNLTGNTVNNDVATFNTPIPGSNIGGAAAPVLTDDATIAGDRSRQIGGITFDTTNCGAYVFSSLSAPALATTLTPETGILNVSHNGSIIMNASVTNNETFLVPIFVRLPSSTAGIYHFVNNSTNNATLFINVVTNDSANTRGTVFTLDGSNTGTNTVGALSAGATTTGANGLTKQGTGTWILAGPNDFRTQTAVNILGGTLVVNDPSAFSAATTATVTNGTLQMNAVTLTQASLNLQKGGNIRMNGTASINGVAVGNQSGTTATLSTTSASDVFTVGTGLSATASLVSGGAADSVLNTAGPGTLVFGQANTYIGNWSFNAATNQIINPSALGTGPNVNVGAGAIFDMTQLGATTFAPTTAGFGGSGTGTTIGATAATVVEDPAAVLDLTSKNVNLTFTPASNSGDLTHPALYIGQGGLTLSGNTFFINNASASPLGVGTYRLIQQASGSITSGGGYAALVSGNGIASGTAASIQVSGGNVDLVIVVYTPKNLVWTGGAANANWDVSTDPNWLNGVSQSVFNNSDFVTFNSVGSTNPTVNLVGTLGPAAITVDTIANDYTFSGTGQIVDVGNGTTTLKKISPGVLNLQTVNTYAGGTVVSNGTLRVGIQNAVSGTGAGDVAVYGTGILDLNGFNNTINALIGDGTVDVQNGGASILTIGNNDASGTFSGLLKNTSGTLALTKLGNGTETIIKANSYTGGTTVSGGTLKVTDPNALGSGAGAVTVAGGTLDAATNLNLLSLAGSSGGIIANNSSSTTNTITIEGTATTIFGGSIVDGSGGGGMALTVLGGSLTMSGGNTYTGGTIVGTGATFAIANGPAAVTGALIASNGATVGLSGGSSTPGTPNSVTTVDGATVTFTSGAEGKIWQAQFIGTANTTNVYTGPVSAGQSRSFDGFPGLVRINLTGNFRFFNGGGVIGGTNTTFEFDAGNVHTRDAQTVVLGSITGGSSACGIGGGSGSAVDTYIIGTKGVDNVFHGYISGSNNIVKAGSARLTLDGAAVTTNTDSATYTNYFYAPLITYPTATTVSNGVLSLVVPNSLSNSPTITLAAPTAVLDASQMGFVSNQMDVTLTVTNQVLATNGLFELFSGQTLGGIGTIWGNLLADSGSIVNPGLPTGILTVTNGIDLESATVNVNVDRSSAQTSSQLAAAGSTSITVNGGTLILTNIGPDMVAGDVFQLFNKAIIGTGFNTISLPVSNALNTVQYTYQTNLFTDGTIKVLTGGSPLANYSTNITATVSGNTLTISWPSTHLGWELALQTNSINVGIANNWVTNYGTANVTSTNFTIDPNNGSVFYRLVHP